MLPSGSEGEKDARRTLVSVPPPEPGLLYRLTHALPGTAPLRAWLEQTRKRVVLLDILLECLEEDTEVGGGILAGALAYRLFLFLLPLAFLLISALGLLSDLLGSTPRAVGRDAGVIGLVSQDVSSAANGGSGVWVALTSIVVLAYATRVLYRSVGIVHALAWDHSAAGTKSELRSLRLFALGVAAQLALSAGVNTSYLTSAVGPVLISVGLVVGIAAVWLGISLVLPHSTARWTDLVPGAVLYGVGILAVHAFDVYLLDFVHRSRSNTYGSLGAAAAVLLSLFLIGRLIVGAAVLNAIVFKRRTRAADL